MIWLWALLALSPRLAFAQGTITVGMPGFPKALLHYAANDELSLAIDSYVFEPLLKMDTTTYRPVPVLAERWRVSPDHLRYTFTLRADARFADGRPVTADDVVFTWQAIHDPRNRFIPAEALFASFSECRAQGREVTFLATAPHFKNLEKLAQLVVLPRHAAADLSVPYPTGLVGSGPFVIAKTALGDSVTLARNPVYWNRAHDDTHFDRIVFRAVPDPMVAMEKFRRHELDLLYMLVARVWATATDTPPFTAGQAKKLVVKTRLPFGYSGIAWNLRRTLFQDVRVRRALAMLLDRPRFLHELFYDAYQLSTGVLKPDSEYHDPALRPLPYDPVSARRLLADAGWRETGPDGILIRNGQRFSFEILAKETAAERFLTRYQESLRRAGIEMHIRIADWTTTLRRADVRDFDGVLVYRGRDIEPSDFAASWGSASALLDGSENVTGFADKRVDVWAMQLDRTFDAVKRRSLARKIDRAIADSAPVAFTWEPTALRFVYWNRFRADAAPPYAPWYEVFRQWIPEPSRGRR